MEALRRDCLASILLLEEDEGRTTVVFCFRDTLTELIDYFLFKRYLGCSMFVSVPEREVEETGLSLIDEFSFK